MPLGGVSQFIFGQPHLSWRPKWQSCLFSLQILAACTCLPWRRHGNFDYPQPCLPWQVVRSSRSATSCRLRRPGLTCAEQSGVAESFPSSSFCAERSGVAESLPSSSFCAERSGVAESLLSSSFCAERSGVAESQRMILTFPNAKNKTPGRSRGFWLRAAEPPGFVGLDEVCLQLAWADILAGR